MGLSCVTASTSLYLCSPVRQALSVGASQLLLPRRNSTGGRGRAPFLSDEFLTSLKTARHSTRTSSHPGTVKLLNLSRFAAFDLTALRHRISRENAHKILAMAKVDRKTLQHPTFRVLRFSRPNEDRVAPLQIRCFTSNSYKAIKERERRKGCRQINTSSQRRSNAQTREGRSEPAQSAAVLEMPRMHSAANNVIPTSDSGDLRRELSVTQDNSRIQPDDDLQQHFSSSSASSKSVLKGGFGGGVQCLASPPSRATSPNARGSESEVITGEEHESELFHDWDPNQRAHSLDDVPMITADSDDAGTSVRKPEIRTRNDTELAVATSSYLTPADSSAARCRSDSCEQLIESHSTRSPSLVSLESNSEHMVAAATSPKYVLSKHLANEALAKVLLDEPRHTVGVARTVGSRTCQARSERTLWIECKSTPQRPWTSEQDEHLLHLRDVAQLNWRNIVSYFLGTTMNAVKGRYKHLNECRMACQIVGDEPKSRLNMNRRSTHLAASTFQKAAKKCRAPSRPKSRRQPIDSLAEHYGPPHRRRVTKQANDAEDVALLADPTHEDVCQRTSHCGRPIRHPFRRRPIEGYL